MSSIAIDAIRQTKLDYFGRSILIVGLGTMGSRCLKKLHALAHPDITLCNRTLAVSESLSSQYETAYFDYTDLASRVGEFDIIISAVTEKTFIIFPENFSSNSDCLLVDLGLPRNVDPSCENLNTIKLINVDGLKEIATKNVKRRQAELSKVEIIFDVSARLSLPLLKWSSSGLNVKAPPLSCLIAI